MKVEPCQACGKNVRVDRRFRMVHVIEFDGPQGDRGWFPIGPDCARKIAPVVPANLLSWSDAEVAS